MKIILWSTQTCKKSVICKICTMMYPTELHGYFPRWKGGGVKPNLSEMDVKPTSANIVSKIISMCVVTIKVTHVEIKREVSTFTMLHNCSQGYFINKKNIRERLGAKAGRQK